MTKKAKIIEKFLKILRQNLVYKLTGNFLNDYRLIYPKQIFIFLSKKSIIKHHNSNTTRLASVIKL